MMRVVFTRGTMGSLRERSEEHTSELQSPYDLVCRLLLDPLPTHIYTLSLHDALPICADCLVPATRDTHSPHRDKNALRCQSHGDVGGSVASARVASEATLADDARRVHTRHNGVVA